MIEDQKKQTIENELYNLIGEFTNKSNDCFFKGDLCASKQYADYVYRLQDLLPKLS